MAMDTAQDSGDLLLSTLGVPPAISTDRMKQLLSQLAGQQHRLATDLAFFKSSADDMLCAVQQLTRCLSPGRLGSRHRPEQLLEREPQLLQHLVLIVAAALQQLQAQGDRDVDVCRTAASIVVDLGCIMRVMSGGESNRCASSANAEVLRILHDSGLLRAYTAAAHAAVSFFDSGPRIQHLDPAHVPVDPSQLKGDPVHMFATASTMLLTFWCRSAELLPPGELLQPNSLLLDSALPTASLAMALARAYAGDRAFCESIMSPVLMASRVIVAATASVQMAGNSKQQPQQPSVCLLACPDAFELVLLGFAVGMELLHADSGGVSQRWLRQSDTSTSSATASSSRGGPGSGGAIAAAGSSNNSSMGGSSRRVGSTTTTTTGKGSKPGRQAVSPHHRELLHALVGVRQLAGLHQRTAAELLVKMHHFYVGVHDAYLARVMNAQDQGVPTSSTSSAAANAKQAVLKGAIVPWNLMLPLHLVQIELLALAPPFFPKPQLLDLLRERLQWLQLCCGQLCDTTRPDFWQQQRPAASGRPSLATVKSQAQLCVQSVWLELGPVLLWLCRHHSCEAAEGEEGSHRQGDVRMPPSPAVPQVTPRQLFASFSAVLLSMVFLQETSEGRTPIINLAAAVERNPVLACSIVEAVLHAAPAYRSDNPGVDYTPGTTCHAASIAIDFLAEAAAIAARKAAAAARGSSGGGGSSSGSSSSGSRLEQQLFCLLVAALKHAQITCSASRTAAEHQVFDLYYNSSVLLCASSSAAMRVLGDVDASRLCLHGFPGPAAAPASVQLSTEQQLLWFHVLGRSLIAAGQLLQQVPERVTASGAFVRTDGQFSQHVQSTNHGAVVRVLVLTVMHMYSMLQRGGAAAAAVSAGAAGAAATPADVSRLLQQAADLGQRLAAIQRVFCPDDFDANGNWAFRNGQEEVWVFPFQTQAAMQRLHAACTCGGLPQQLRSFGMACCAAFPQRGVCGNGACTNLERFSETALASQGCSGCSKAVKFCSLACHKKAWKEGHKAACAVLKQRQAAAEATGLQA